MFRQNTPGSLVFGLMVMCVPIFLSFQAGLGNTISQLLWDGVALWRWDTELHSTYGLFAESGQWLGAHQVENKRLLTRFPEELVTGWPPYLSTVGLSAFAINSTSLVVQGPELMFWFYALNIIFSVITFYVFALGLRLLSVKWRDITFLALPCLTPWLLLDLTTIHWNPALRFLPVFLAPLAVYFFRRHRKVTGAGIITLGTFVSLGNGYEFLPVLVAIGVFSFLLFLSRREAMLVASSFLGGLVTSVLAWMMVLWAGLGNLARVIEGVFFVVTKHGNGSAGIELNGFASGFREAGLQDLTTSIYFETIFFLPLTRESLATMLDPDSPAWLFFAAFASPILTGVALIALSIYGKALATRALAATVASNLALVATSWPIRRYVINHEHILGSGYAMFFGATVISVIIFGLSANAKRTRNSEL